MQITQDMFKWLKSLNVLQNGIPKQNGRIELDPEATSAFYNGFKMSELLDKLVGTYSQPIKPQVNATARLFNWNIVTERLHQLKIEVDGDIKKLIVDGDLEMIVEILKDIQSKFVKETTQKIENQKKLFDIETLNSAKPISSCETVLEFIIVALSQNLVLKPKQSSQLLNNNFKLLTHVFIKGVKGLYNQLITLLQELYNNMPRLIELLREEEHQISFFVQFLKLSLFSKDNEVVHWGLRLFGKLGYELAQHDLLFHLFQWLLNQGLSSFIITLQRQPQLAEPLATALSQIAYYDYSQILGIQKYFENPKSYIEFYGTLMPYLNCDLTNYNLEQQIQIAIRLGDNSSTRDEKTTSILFLCNSWIFYSQFLEQNMQYQQSILAIIQRCAKDNSTILKPYSITQAFKLLDGLAQRKVVTAVSVYKKLISILVENQNNEYIVRQFTFIIQKYPSIPIELLIEGLIKNHQINMSDCDIYYVLSSHQNLKVYSAIQMLELLIRIYNSNIFFQSALFPAIQQIIQKFIELNEFQDYMNRMAQSCLSLYVNSVRQKKTTTQNSHTNYQDDSVINQQRRALIIQLFKYIVQLKCFSMNNILKPLLVGAHLELRNIENRENKGIMQILQMLGDPNTIVEEVIQNDSQMSSQLFLEKKMQQMEGSRSQALEDQYLQQNKKLFEKEEDLVKSLLLEEKNEAKDKTQKKKKKRNYDFEDFQCIYDEGDLAYKPQEILLIDFSIEEDVDRESINIAIKYYEKTFRYLFNKYATSPQEAAKKRLRNLDQNQIELRSSDIVKILQDFEIYNFSTYEEIINLIAAINHNQQQQTMPQLESQTEKQSSISATTSRTQNQRLDYDNFKRFLIQYSVLIFGRPPKDFRKMPAGHVLVEFFKYFSFVSRRRNENHLIFDDPDGVTTVADKNSIQKWNAQLLQNPQTEIPSETRLKKVQTEKVSLQYQMRNVIPNLNKSFLVCFEIVNDLIQSRFKTNIVEPTFKVNLIYEVKPIAAKGVHQDLKIDPLAEKQEYLKSSLSLLPQEKQEILNKSMDLSLISEDKIINKSIVEKLVNQTEQVLKKELKDMKWKKHKEYLDKQYEKIQQHRENQEQNRLVSQAKVAEMKIAEQEIFKPKHSDYMSKLKKELRKNQSEITVSSGDPIRNYPLSPKKLETAKLLQQSLQQLPSQKNESPKKQDPKGQKQDQKLDPKQQQQQQQGQKLDPKQQQGQKQDQQKQQPQDKKQPPQQDQKQKKQENKAEQRFKARTAEMADHYKVSLEKKEQLNEKFSNFYKDPKVQAEFKHFRSSGSMAFNHFLKHSDAWNYSGKKIVLQGWLDFAQSFNLDQVFNNAQLIKIFTNTLKQKNYIGHREAVQKNLKYQDETGLTYFEFEYMILKSAILGQEYFNAIQSGKKLDDNLKQLLIYKDKLAKKPKIKHKHVEQMEENMNKTTSFTLAACLAFMDVPQNKDLFAGKLRSIEGQDIIEETQPRYQSVDLSQIKKKKGLPETPNLRQSQWAIPGTHNKNQEQAKPLTESQVKLPFLKKDVKNQELLEITKKWQEVQQPKGKK